MKEQTVSGTYELEREDEDGDTLTYDVEYSVFARRQGHTILFSAIDIEPDEDIELTQEEIELIEEAARDHARDLMQGGFV